MVNLASFLRLFWPERLNKCDLVVIWLVCILPRSCFRALCSGSESRLALFSLMRSTSRGVSCWGRALPSTWQGCGEEKRGAASQAGILTCCRYTHRCPRRNNLELQTRDRMLLKQCKIFWIFNTAHCDYTLYRSICGFSGMQGGYIFAK